MGLTAVAATMVGAGLLPLARYAIEAGPPRDVGDLTHVQLGRSSANRWVHAVGPLAARGVEYQRPLDSDRYRLVQSADNPRVWVELRIPKDIEPEYYVAPNSFVGRLVPLENAGLRYGAVADAAETILGHALPSGTWVLIDGESPATTRWSVAFVALFAAFAAFNIWGIGRLLLPVNEGKLPAR